MELLLLSTLTGITTMIGVILALIYGEPGRKILAFYLGLSAGIMSLIILLDLIPTAFEEGPMEAVGMGLGLGIFTMMVVYRFLKYLVRDRWVGAAPSQKEYYQTGLLMAIAIAVHNIPEGIAIGAGFHNHHELGVMLALSIALHNVPEGIGMTVPFRMAGVKWSSLMVISLMISLCIPIGAWIGQLFFIGSPFFITLGLAFAAGAMGFIVWKEVGPTSLKYHPLSAQLGMALSIGLLYILHLLR